MSAPRVFSTWWRVRKNSEPLPPTSVRLLSVGGPLLLHNLVEHPLK